MPSARRQARCWAMPARQPASASSYALSAGASTATRSRCARGALPRRSAGPTKRHTHQSASRPCRCSRRHRRSDAEAASRAEPLVPHGRCPTWSGNTAPRRPTSARTQSRASSAEPESAIRATASSEPASRRKWKRMTSSATAAANAPSRGGVASPMSVGAARANATASLDRRLVLHRVRAAAHRKERPLQLEEHGRRRRRWAREPAQRATIGLAARPWRKRERRARGVALVALFANASGSAWRKHFGPSHLPLTSTSGWVGAGWLEIVVGWWVGSMACDD